VAPELLNPVISSYALGVPELINQDLPRRWDPRSVSTYLLDNRYSILHRNPSLEGLGKRPYSCNTAEVAAEVALAYQTEAPAVSVASVCFLVFQVADHICLEYYMDLAMDGWPTHLDR